MQAKPRALSIKYTSRTYYSCYFTRERDTYVSTKDNWNCFSTVCKVTNYIVFKFIKNKWKVLPIFINFFTLFLIIVICFSINLVWVENHMGHNRHWLLYSYWNTSLKRQCTMKVYNFYNQFRKFYLATNNVYLTQEKFNKRHLSFIHHNKSIFLHNTYRPVLKAAPKSAFILVFSLICRPK